MATAVKKTAVQWVPDENAEKILKEAGHKFQVTQLKTGDIHWKASLQNIGRPEKALDEDRVWEIAENMERGFQFPMPVIADVRGKKLILSGNHRSNAALLCDVSRIDCYLITLDDMQEFRALGFEMNRVVGVANPYQVALEQAVEMVRSGSISVHDACQRFRVKDGALRRSLKIAECRDELMKQNIAAHKCNDVQIEQVARIKNANVCRELGRLVSENPRLFTQKTSRDLCNRVLKKNTEADQIDVVLNERQRLDKLRAEKNGRNRKPYHFSEKAKLSRAVHALETTIGERTIIDQFGFDPESEECVELRKEINAVIKRLRGLFTSGSKVKRKKGTR